MNKSLHHLLMVNHNLVQDIFFEKISNLNLSLGQPKILEYLYKNEGAIQKDIARECAIRQSSISSILKNMEKKDLVKKVYSKENKRIVRIYLSEKSKNIIKNINENFKKVDKKALEGFNNDEKKLLQKYLLRVFENLRED